MPKCDKVMFQLHLVYWISQWDFLWFELYEKKWLLALSIKSEPLATSFYKLEFIKLKSWEIFMVFNLIIFKLKICKQKKTNKRHWPSCDKSINCICMMQVGANWCSMTMNLLPTVYFASSSLDLILLLDIEQKIHTWVGVKVFSSLKYICWQLGTYLNIYRHFTIAYSCYCQTIFLSYLKSPSPNCWNPTSLILHYLTAPSFFPCCNTRLTSLALHPLLYYRHVMYFSFIITVRSADA